MLDQSCLKLENFPIMLMRMRLVWSRQKLLGEMGSPVAILGSCICGSSPAATVLSPQAPTPTELGSAHRRLETSEWGHTDQDLSMRHGETAALLHSSDSQHGHGKAQAAFLKAGHCSESPWELLKCANSFSFREEKHVLVPMDGLASQALKGEIQMSQPHTECLPSGPAGLRMLDGRTLAF